MSKTVNYVDQYGNFQKVYASKNGKFLNHPKLGTIDVSKTGCQNILIEKISG